MAATTLPRELTLDVIYPVGSVYISMSNTNPADLFGGSWTQIKDTFLLAVGDTYTANSTGGSTGVTLTTDHLPSHTHDIPQLGGSTNNTGSHKHTFYYGRSWGTGAVDCSGSGGSTALSYAWLPSNNMENAGGHTHSVTTNASTTGATGTSTPTAISTMPPYRTVYMWERTA